MVHKYLPPYSGDDRDDTFELLERSQTGRATMDVMYMKGWRGKAYLAWFGISGQHLRAWLSNLVKCYRGLFGTLDGRLQMGR